MERQKHGALGGSWEPAGFSKQVKSQGGMVRGIEGEAGESTLLSGTFYSSKLLLFSPDYSERPLSSDFLCPTLKAKRGPGRASSLAELPGDLHDNTPSPRPHVWDVWDPEPLARTSGSCLGNQAPLPHFPTNQTSSALPPLCDGQLSGWMGHHGDPAPLQLPAF